MFIHYSHSHICKWCQNDVRKSSGVVVNDAQIDASAVCSCTEFNYKLDCIRDTCMSPSMLLLNLTLVDQFACHVRINVHAST